MTRHGIIMRKGGFTLIEVIISMSIVILLLLVLVSITDSTQRTWTYATAKVEQFRDAREAFEAITRKLSQATLNTYLDYDYPLDANGVPDTTQPPTRYMRQSELRFRCGPAATLLNAPNYPTHAIFFQTPEGAVSGTNYTNLDMLLNTCGYFIEFGSDGDSRPDFISSSAVALRYRFRLKEMVEPSDDLTLYKYTNGQPGYNGTTWFTDPMGWPSPPVQTRAENIVALIILPKLAPEEDPTGAKLSSDYTYDSTSSNSDPTINPKNQLPPIIQVTMVAVDESSFNRYQHGTTMPALIPDGLFTQVGDLTNSSNPGYAKDLKTLTDALRNAKLNYRVFTSDVSLKAAKWSCGQKN